MAENPSHPLCGGSLAQNDISEGLGPAFAIYILRGDTKCGNLFFMKQYVIDELRPEDYKKIKAYMDENFGDSALEGVYWMPLDREMLTGIQSEHVDCQPFYFAMELEPNRMACELLVRTKSRIRCGCIGYATEAQRNWIIGVTDAIFEKLEIIT
jgi:hypothetical protein